MKTAEFQARNGWVGAHDRDPGPGRLSRWLWLGAGFICIWAFMFVIVPGFNDLPVVKPLIDYNVANDVKATALFYSDVEETSEAQNYLKNSKGFFNRAR